MTYAVARPDAEIDEVLNLAAEAEERGSTSYHGMTFEMGVAQGIQWACGIGDAEAPLP